MMRKRYSGKEYAFNIEVIDESADNIGLLGMTDESPAKLVVE